jgi:aminoglycoside phosphotransferase (APT) family kinase protein
VNAAGVLPLGVAPGWIIELFEPGFVRAVSPLGWGFQNETWKVELADGRPLAVTRIDRAEAAAAVLSLTRLVRPRLVAAGVPVPAVVELGSTVPPGILVTDFVEGTPGAELFDEREGPAVVGSVLGSTWRKLADVDPSGLALPVIANPPAGGRSSTAAALAHAGQWLTRSERRQLSAEIRAASDLLAGREPGFVHGDLAPVNVVIRDRTLAALLDLESVRLADPLLDAAWFDWIVAYHHPAHEAAAWRAFVTASGLDERDPTTRQLLGILPLIRLVEILDDHSLRSGRADHWIRMLRACLARAR